ncbi:RabGAP/TBC [Rhizodiscina lignyota]|uniref:GTPase-activating protein GYP5 n=1 Tax=Rhizodiscina lignyota TaxID=1504668 RepID=A0A9P4I5W2_9PEZI|nr:RabGAP/TBC [Rhizodiscina lignyota]
MENHTPNEEKSDQEVEETFEDAPDTTPRPPPRDRVRSSSSHSVRSLTGRRPSQSSVQELDKQRSSTGTPVVPEAENEDDEHALGGKPKVNGTSEKAEGHTDGAHDAVEGTAPSVKSASDGDMDEVNLAEAPKLPPRDSGPRNSGSSMQGFSGTFHNSFPPPPSAPPKRVTSPKKEVPPPPPPPEKAQPPPRKLASPFSWLSRNTSNDKKAAPSLPPRTPSHERSDTKASSITLNSNSTGHVQNGDEARVSLKARFKLLRLQEETTTTVGEDEDEDAANGGALAGLVGRSATIGLGVGSPVSANDEKPEVRSPEVKSPGIARQQTINPNLPPGTAAGLQSSESDAPVNWDLWQNVVYEGPAAVARTSEAELKEAIASGIPQAIRGVVWQVIADSSNEDLQNLYKELVARGAETNGTNKEMEHIKSSASSIHSAHSTPAVGSEVHGSWLPYSASESAVQTNGRASSPETDLVARMIHDARNRPAIDTASIQKLEKMIRRDLGARTSYSKYVMAAGLQDGLFGVCKAYALLDEQVGYAQGMNFIAMPLLFNMTEDEAFSLMMTLMTHPKYRLRNLFTAEMPGLHLLLYQFARALEDLDPQLYYHLHRRGVEPRLYATQWFLTLFAYRFPLQLVLRVYDFVLSEGLESAMIRFGTSLVIKNREALIDMRDMSALTTFLKEKLFDVYIDKSPSASSIKESGFFGTAGGADKEVYKADELVCDAVAIDIEPGMLRAYETEWTEQTRIEKEREAELESLRSNVTALSLKVRRLEEAAEKSDTEHVEMATDLVRTKVENQTLKDENEGLKGQVEELRKVVENQPAEVEAKMRNEMESVMERNVEIFGENRRLEEELGEMEKVLVGLKMEHAQVSFLVLRLSAAGVMTDLCSIQLSSDHEGLKSKWNNIAGLIKPIEAIRP